MQHPLLYLGLMGFDAASQAGLRRWLKAYAVDLVKSGSRSEGQQAFWEVVDFSEADALLIRGAGVTQGFASHLQFDPALQTIQANAPLGVQLDAVRLPFAISDVKHLQSFGIDLKTHPIFDLESPASMLRTLQHFETLLRPLCSLFALAKELTDRSGELDSHHTFHLERNGNLEAVIDLPQRRVMMHPGTRPLDISAAAWLSRPKSANFAPAHFLECSMDEVAWVYAMHCQATDLPKRYFSKPIHVRRNPRVRTSLMYPRHAALMERLWQQPQTLEQLQKALPHMPHLIERDVFGLYLTRSISTTAPNEPASDGSSLPGTFDTTGKWLLQRPGQRMNTMAGELQSLF